MYLTLHQASVANQKSQLLSRQPEASHTHPLRVAAMHTCESSVRMLKLTREKLDFSIKDYVHVSNSIVFWTEETHEVLLQFTLQVSLRV